MCPKYLRVKSKHRIKLTLGVGHKHQLSHKTGDKITTRINIQGKTGFILLMKIKGLQLQLLQLTKLLRGKWLDLALLMLRGL